MRLRLHFARVLLLLRAADVPDALSADARERSLRRLRAYAREGRFPRHGGRGARRPVFVDAEGTHCAMGHLLAADGHAALVQGIAAGRNHAYVAELASTPGLLAAVAGLGLTASEAALVQPTYDGGAVATHDADPTLYALWTATVIVSAVLASSGVLLAAGMLLSARVRRVAWTGGLWRRVFSVAILGLGVLGLWMLYLFAFL
jgi:hypothetical protein